MTKSRFLMGLRLLLGVLLIRQGTIGLADLQHLAQTLQVFNAWQSWPVVNSLRPMELALWIGAGEFTVGIFLVGGLLTRFMALASAVLTAFGLATLWRLSLPADVAHGGLLLGSLVVLFKGGGSGTMDSELGRMQRRSLEREAEREAARRAA